MSSPSEPRWSAIVRARRERPRSRVVRGTLVAFLALAGLSLATGAVSFEGLFDERRRANLERFLQKDLMPYPLQSEGFSWSGLWAWALDLWIERGRDAFFETLAIAVVSIVLAGLVGAIVTPLGARSLMTDDPYVARTRHGGSRGVAWRAVAFGVRTVAVCLRAIPEYVWAFLLLAILGVNAWPVVLALAVHNAGILGRLGADTFENLDPRPLRALRGMGATRFQVATRAGFPAMLSRYLLYFFYRYETCIREATVLGMVGVASLGYWIQDARARLYYDEMAFFVVLGAVLVLFGDLSSSLARAWLRREG